MKILIGALSLDDITYYVSNGADEVYCGFTKIKNARPDTESFSEVSQVCEAIDITHQYKKKIFLAINDTTHPDHYHQIDQYLAKFIKHGLDGVIIKDTFLLDHFNRAGLRTYFILSCLAECCNIQALDLYRQYGIARVVLPRHTLPEESLEMVRNKFNIETEVFFPPETFCRNTDGFCRLHAWKPIVSFLPCGMKFKQGKKDFWMPSRPLVDQLSNFYDFYKLGVPYLKIGRGNAIRKKAYFNQALDLLELLGQKGMTRQIFMKKGLATFSRLPEHFTSEGVCTVGARDVSYTPEQIAYATQVRGTATLAAFNDGE
ncbi:MAG: U32 family peptidase [Candidatus Omnitrophica bacterium]|nr:U32 family peptidase [Candidatus Omnitrophota bacterium]